MRIAYLTTDEANQDLALELAQRHDIMLCIVEPRDSAPVAGFDGVLCDWDYWPAEAKVPLLQGWLGQASVPPLGLHSYQMDGEQAEALRRRGIAVHRVLEPGVFTALRQAILAGRVAALGGESCGLLPTGQRGKAA
jgi:hypothetical protein